MRIENVLIAAIAGYLIGSISFARLVSGIAAPQEDITRTEIDVEESNEKLHMKAVSATTVSIHLGPRLGFLTVVMDMLKITIPTLIAKHLYPETESFLITATAGMIGHIWPIYYRFQGGRGLSAVYGGMFAIDWIGVFATSIGGMLFGLFILRDVLVAYVAGLWLLIPWLWFRTHDVGHVLYAVAVNILFLLGIVPELRQYVRFRREGKGSDVGQVMQLTGMGRGIYRMARRFGILDTPPGGDG
ncbi:MAG: glycerol-3-phosphate acyltransferase [Anaerolineae bacterium]